MAHRWLWTIPPIALAAGLTAAALVPAPPPQKRPVRPPRTQAAATATWIRPGIAALPTPGGRPSNAGAAANAAPPDQPTPPLRGPARTDQDDARDSRRPAPAYVPRRPPSATPEAWSPPPTVAPRAPRMESAPPSPSPAARGPVHPRLSASLAGQVLARTDGTPVQARLLLRPALEGAPLQTTSDLDGAFRFERLPAGDWILAIEAEGFLPTERPLRLAVGQRHEQVFLEHAWGTVCGEVVSRADQAPIFGAVVRVEGAEASTDGEGRFQIDRVATGTRRLHADADGFAGASITLPVLGGAQQLVVELDPLPYEGDGE